MADNGFFPDPYGEWSVYYSGSAKELEQLGSISCAVLLGEPGTGKSTALRADYKRVKATGAKAQFVHLGETQDESSLRARLFESDTFKSWGGGDDHLHLFLDSLDEARLRVETVATMLMSGLEKADFGRLSLRVACRISERHVPLEAFLRAAFGEENFRVLSLAPLRRLDVEYLAERCGVDQSEFVSSCVKHSLQPLAIVPLTLGMLLKSTKASGEIPRDRTQAYEQGLRLLCSESNPDRETGTTAGGNLSEGERFSVAVRIAAALKLSGRSSITTKPGLVNADSVAMSDLAGGSEQNYAVSGEATFQVDEAAIRETLGSSLFTVDSEGRSSVSHAYFGDFLAARWLSSSGLGLDQVLDLLTVSDADDSDPSVVPQLLEVASWLSGLWPPFLRYVAAHHPLVALRGNLDGASDLMREQLVFALVQAAGEDYIDLYDRQLRAEMEGLEYSGLAAQLRLILQDETRTQKAKECACEVARACKTEAIEDELLNLSLNSDVPVPLRVQAVRALEEFGGDKTFKRLLPMVIESQPLDTDDELKGTVFRRVWPGLMSCGQALRALNEPKNRNLLGAYKSFVWGDFVKGLEDRDLPAALRWASELPSAHDPMDSLDEVREELLLKSWPMVGNNEAITKGFARVVVTLLKGHEDLLDNTRRTKHPEAFTDADKRRALIRQLVPAITEQELEPVVVAFMCHPPLVCDVDFDWLVERLKSTIGKKNEPGWANLVALVGRGTEDLMVLELCDQSPELKTIAGGRFAAVAIDSEEAESARKVLEISKERQQQDEKENSLRDEMLCAAKSAIAAMSKSKPEDFWHALYHLEHIPPQSPRTYADSDLTEFPGWSLLTADEQTKLGEFAPRYLKLINVPPKEWVPTRQIRWDVWAGYRALRLAHDCVPDQLAKLPKKYWVRWLPIVLDWPREGESESDFNTWLLGELAMRCPAELAEGIDAQILRDRDQGFVNDARLEAAWCEAVEERVLRRAKDRRISTEKRRALVEVLVRRKSEAGLGYAYRLVVPDAVRSGGARRKLATMTAVVLAVNDSAKAWPRVHELMGRFPRLAKDIIREFSVHRESIWISKLDASQAGELFETAEKHFPIAEDPSLDDQRGNYPVRAQIADWRNNIVRILQAMASADSVRVLSEISARRPRMLGFKKTLREAQQALLAQSWLPPSPAGIVQMSGDQARRWVRSDSDLRDVVVASLDRAQAALQGVHPRVGSLWNTDPVTPKPENHLSDWLRDFLREDLKGKGVLVDRETEVRSGPKNKMGEAVDIQVNAVAGDRVEGAPIVSLMIEVKGCWHRNVLTEIETKLADRYLDPKRRYGLYVVGCFASEQWDPSDYRKKACSRFDRAELSKKLDVEPARINHEKEVRITPLVLDCSLAKPPLA